MNIIDSRTLAGEVHDLNTNAVTSYPRDNQLACVSSAWLAGPFTDFVRSNTRKYTPEKYDCDDFSYKAVTLIVEALNETDGLTDCGVAFGLVKLHIVGELARVRDGNHMCNLARLDNGSIVFYEPQNGIITDARAAIRSGVARPYQIEF